MEKKNERNTEQGNISGPEWQCSKCGAEIFNVTHIPYKKKDAFAMLDAMLSEEDKKEMTN